GGADSLAVLQLLQHAGYDIAAAHCNFRLRAEASDADEALVGEFCKDINIHLYKTSFDTKSFARANKLSIEMSARELRYNWFNDLLTANRFSAVVTGHHGNDSIETFFLNLVRGTGLKGLSGISYRNENVVRPLLDFSREEIETYCREQDIVYCHDASNDDCQFTRNKIRHEVIPVLQTINPSFFDTMQSNLGHLQDAERMLESEVQRFLDTDVVNEAGQVIIPISRLANYPHYASLLFEVLRPYGFNSAVVGEVIKHLHGESGKQFFTETHRLIKDRHNLLILPVEEIGVQHFWVEEGDQAEVCPMSVCVYTRPDNFQFSRDARLVHFDADLVELPLLVRKWKQGDAFMPLGMKGFKKISDFFIDQKYSLKDKEDAWLMISGEDIIWIVGKRLDDRFKVTNRTKRILEIALK
ncbi:MAG: tRNA lysidine(34) synthetase TilS, partial [Carboxylicivirga sp.]|nr:tRNA lysidine(34) synthetase TilS [Carboxylicivirga sp.]